MSLIILTFYLFMHFFFMNYANAAYFSFFY